MKKHSKRKDRYISPKREGLPLINPAQWAVLMVGLVVLVVALFRVYDWVSDGASERAFFNTYKYGYAHRGLLGTILSFFPAGDYSIMEMRVFAKKLSLGLVTLNLCFLWLLLIPKIVLTKSFSTPMRWWLMAFSGVLLFSHSWRPSTGPHLGLMDVYFYFCLLGACVALIVRRPVIFALLMIAAQMIHRGGYLMSLSLSIMVMYAVWFAPIYRLQVKQWLVAAALPTLFFVITSFVHNPDAMILNAPTPSAEDIAQGINVQDIQRGLEEYVNFNTSGLGTNKISQFLLVNFRLQPSLIWWSFIIFCGPSLLLSALFFWFRRQHQMGFWLAKPSEFAYPPSGWARRIEILLPLMAVVCTLPALLVGVDTGRFLMWSWLNLSLITVCQLWIFSPSGTTVSPRPKNTKHKPVVVWATTVLLAGVAYMYGGANMVFIHDANSPTIYSCRTNCFSFIYQNPLARAYQNFAWPKLVLATNYPLRINAAEFRQGLNVRNFSTPVRNGNLLVLADEDNAVYSSNILMPRPIMVYRADYKLDHFNGESPLSLKVRGKVVEPQQITKDYTQWVVNFGAAPIHSEMNLINQHPEDFELISLFIDSRRQ